MCQHTAQILFLITSVTMGKSYPHEKGEKKMCDANGRYIKEYRIIKKDSWSKSIITEVHRWQHQTYQHQPASVMAAASQRGMRTRHQLSSGSILRLFVKRPVTLPESGDVCSHWILLLTFFCRASRCPCFPSPSHCMCQRQLFTAEMFIWEEMHLREYLVAIIQMPDYIPRITLLKTKTALTHCGVLQMRWVYYIWAIIILSSRYRR